MAQKIIKEINVNGVDHIDAFDDCLVCWVNLSAPPDEVEKEAKQIDEDNYVDSCFGCCAHLNSEGFCIVCETLEYKEIFYIDNDGEKHWLDYTLSDEIKRQCYEEIIRELSCLV